MTGFVRSSKAQRRVKRRKRLWRKDSRCHWCGVETLLWQHMPGQTQPDNLATLDHLYAGNDPRRSGKVAIRQTVLACRRCNGRRGCMLLETWKEMPVVSSNTHYLAKAIAG